MTTLLEAENLRVERGGRVLFDGVSLTVRPGDKIAVTGPSGSGKTSLLAVLAGLEAPHGGTVLRDGKPAQPGRLPDGTAAVLQGYGLVSLLTAAENIEIVLRAAGTRPAKAIATAATALADLGLADYADHLLQELSGGQQQRVAVARALAARPALLIADEPTAEQDARTREIVLARMLAVAAEGGAVILATHDPDVAERCDTIVRLAHHIPSASGWPSDNSSG
ncbi:MAG TPA: heme ABC exporter ATP-binding protein CcmA [Trebonia sp.]